MKKIIWLLGLLVIAMFLVGCAETVEDTVPEEAPVEEAVVEDAAEEPLVE